MFRASNDRGPKSNCLLYIIPRHYTWTFRRAGDRVFHSNLISTKKGVAPPCRPIKVKFLRMFTLCYLLHSYIMIVWRSGV